MLVNNMTSESNNFPIYIKFVEQKGEKTERLIEEIKMLSQRFNIYEEVSLSNITPSTSGSDENSLIYRIDINPNSHSEKSKRTIEFMEYLFQKLFDKYPSLTDPYEGNDALRLQ